MAKRWYVVHAYSGYEKKVKDTLKERISLSGMSDFFDEETTQTTIVVLIVIVIVAIILWLLDSMLNGIISSFIT